jgi:TonB family protein
VKKVAVPGPSQFSNLPAMVNGAFGLRRDRTAIACSIAIHCCVLAALVTVPRIVFNEDVPSERTLLVSMIRIDRRPPLRAVRLHPAAAPRALRIADVPPLHVAKTVKAERALVVAPEVRYRPRALHMAPANTPAAPAEQSAEAAAPDAHPLVATAATVVANAAPSLAPSAAAHEDGIGNFGENYPAQVDPQARSGLFEGVAGSVVLRVEIDETGRVTAISFIRAPADPALKEALRTRVLAARFIPAACNGLRCSDTIELRN